MGDGRSALGVYREAIVSLVAGGVDPGSFWSLANSQWVSIERSESPGVNAPGYNNQIQKLAGITAFFGTTTMPSRMK